MKVIAVIIDPDEAKKILRHLVKIGRAVFSALSPRLNTWEMRLSRCGL